MAAKRASSDHHGVAGEHEARHDAQTKAAGTAGEAVELAIEEAKLAGLEAGGLTDIWTVLPRPSELPDIWTMAAGNASAAGELFIALAGFGGFGS